MPWRWIILGTAIAVLVIGMYAMRRRQRAEAMRTQMLALLEGERVSDLSERYLAFRDRIEGMVHRAARGPAPRNWADPRLNLSGLRSGEGLYLRIPTRIARNRHQIPDGALGMTPDAITRCLGLAPMSMRGLYERGDFLTPEWLDQVRNEETMMKLRVLDDQLGRHVQVDAPVVVSMMRADWFLLVLQRGENRRDHPVDVYLWDLRANRQLLRARIQGRGLLVPVRLRFEGTNPPAAPANPQLRSGGAQDCSIASQIRGLTGEEPVDFESGGQLLEQAVEAPEEGEAAPDSEEGTQEPRN